MSAETFDGFGHPNQNQNSERKMAKAKQPLVITSIFRTRKTIRCAWTQGEASFDLEETENPLPAFLLAQNRMAFMKELFPLDSIQMDSPRAAWIKKHRVMTLHTPHTEEAPWCAWFLGDNETPENYGVPSEYKTGFDENDAIAELAIAAGLKLWNEEQP